MLLSFNGKLHIALYKEEYYNNTLTHNVNIRLMCFSANLCVCSHLDTSWKEWTFMPTSNSVERSTQTDETQHPKPVDAYTQTDSPMHNYDEEVPSQAAIAEKAKERYEAA